MGNRSNPYVALAVKAVRHYFENGTPLPCPKDLPDELKQKSGAFICIKKAKDLRGCIGTVVPTHENLALEIIHNAISAATKDPRFSSVTEKELPHLDFSVDVLTPLEKIDDPSQLDCKRYGLVVKHEKLQGVLLPDLEGIDTVESQIRVCLRKAGIKDNQPYEMHRFQVERHS